MLISSNSLCIGRTKRDLLKLKERLNKEFTVRTKMIKESLVIVLASNFMNHHMLPLCLELQKLTCNNFYFVATSELPKDRINLGYQKMNDKYDFVICAYKNNNTYKYAKRLCYECDVLIYGSAPECFYLKRLSSHKLTFRYSERVLKNPFRINNTFKRIVKFLIRDAFTQYNKHFLLAASAYAADDFNRFGLFIGRSLKWGYFPPSYSIERKKSENNKMLNILWVGRLISYKKPEIAVDVANELNKRRLDFNLRIVGSGILENEVRKRIIDLNLERCVTVEGSKSNEEVRNIMRHSDVFLFTSNEEEGWGAVLNEAMDSGCVCIAYHGIGAVPYLIKDGENGFIYCHHSPAEIANICERLYLERGLIDRISQNAIETIKENWNAEVAAYRLFETANTIIQSNKIIPYEEGPLSIAQRVSCNATE